MWCSRQSKGFRFIYKFCGYRCIGELQSPSLSLIDGWGRKGLTRRGVSGGNRWENCRILHREEQGGTSWPALSGGRAGRGWLCATSLASLPNTQLQHMQAWWIIHYTRETDDQFVTVVRADCVRSATAVIDSAATHWLSLIINQSLSGRRIPASPAATLGNAGPGAQQTLDTLATCCSIAASTKVKSKLFHNIPAEGEQEGGQVAAPVPRLPCPAPLPGYPNIITRITAYNCNHQQWSTIKYLFYNLLAGINRKLEIPF